MCHVAMCAMWLCVPCGYVCHVAMCVMWLCVPCGYVCHVAMCVISTVVLLLSPTLSMKCLCVQNNTETSCDIVRSAFTLCNAWGITHYAIAGKMGVEEGGLGEVVRGGVQVKCVDNE